MKTKTRGKMFRHFWKGLAGICLSVSVFVLPVTGFAEETADKAAAPQKYVMPQEQVYLDPGQVEAAKKQLEADAFYNDRPQETSTASNEATVKEADAKPDAEQKPEAASQKYVMPQEQVYLDPSQVEAAKQQLKADAFYNDNPLTKNVEVVSGDRVIANVEVVEKEEKPAPAEKVLEATKPAAPDNAGKEEKVSAENKTVAETTSPAVKEEPAPVAASVPVATEITPVPVETPPASAPAATDPVKKPIRLHHFGLVKEHMTHQATVADVLKDMNINMEDRTVYPSPETAITDGMVIHVLARKSFLSQEEAEVPFGKQIINDPELAYGTEKVEKEGVKGKDLITYENITRAGHEQKIELDRRRVVEPVNAVVRKGVAQSILTPDGYVKYKKVIYGEATAYTWGGGATGHTSVGLWPKRGIIAVDPRVIPYYTKVYIPGYGMAIAGDTGGAIVGTRIDLFMDSLHECYQWGRRDVKIYILE